MVFTETSLRGVFIIDLEPHEDERGFFARSWCRREFQTNGLNSSMAQCNVSFNKRKGTLRGMHYQLSPHTEAKLVRCTMGGIYDVALDLRHNLPTFKQWVAVQLTGENRRMLYIPEGVAHGFQTLTDNTELFYQISEFYDAESARGVRWDDPAFGIAWPHEEQRIISLRDQSYPDFDSPLIGEKP